MKREKMKRALALRIANTHVGLISVFIGRGNLLVYTLLCFIFIGGLCEGHLDSFEDSYQGIVT